MGWRVEYKYLRRFIIGVILSITVLGLTACFPIRPEYEDDYSYSEPYYYNSGNPDYYDYDPYYAPYNIYPEFYGLFYWGNYYPGYSFRGYPYSYPLRPGFGGRLIR
jgi:hypothetical protein